MKTDGNYRMHRSIKRMTASIMDRKERENYKRFAIDADASRKRQEFVILGRGEKE
jgi:hypothetical protein